VGKEVLKISDMPYLVEQWDFSKNSDDISEISAKSDKSKYWKCKKCGYSWESSPKARIRALGKCPCCDSGKAIQRGYNDVFTVVPELKESYDFIKNEGFDIYNEGINSLKKVFWKCDTCGRSWNTSIVSRIKKDNGQYEARKCPHYNTEKRKAENVPLVIDSPELMKFWNRDKNHLDPNLVRSNSTERAFWYCANCGYEWETTIIAQGQGTGKCACCELFKVPRAGISDAFTLVPDLKKSYDSEKNRGVDISNLGVRDTSTPLWWKCQTCGFEWESTLASRVRGKRGNYSITGCRQCYYQDKNRITPVSSFPKLLKFWDFDKNKDMDPNLTSAHSYEYANWKCKECGYTWRGTIRGRTAADNMCPCCDKGKRIHKGINDVVTLVPDIMKIFDPNENSDIDIYSCGINSAVVVSWSCEKCGNKWKSPVSQRVHKEKTGTYRLVDCPECGNRGRRQLSYAEQYPELTQAFNEERSGRPLATITSTESNTVKLWWNCTACGNTFQSRLQSMITALNTSSKGCPYCSKTLLLPGNSFADIHPELMSEYDPENNIDAYEAFPNSKKTVKWICKNNSEHRWEASFALRHTGGGTCPVCNRTLLVVGINTFADKYPALVEMWSSRNERKANEVFYNSSLWFQWVCPKCEGEYGARIAEVVSGEADCPYCNDRRVLPGYNSLLARYPALAERWSSSNATTPDDILPEARTPVNWVCPECHGEYEARVAEMVSGEADCPYCNDRRVLAGFNSFKIKHSELMGEWAYLPNYLLADPDRISDSCNTPVWWNCQNNKEHLYVMSPRRRILFQKRHRESCPYCKGRRRKKRHFV